MRFKKYALSTLSSVHQIMLIGFKKCDAGQDSDPIVSQVSLEAFSVNFGVMCLHLKSGFVAYFVIVILCDIFLWYCVFC